MLSAVTSTYTTMRTPHSCGDQWRRLQTRFLTQSLHRQELLTTQVPQFPLLLQGRMKLSITKLFHKNISRSNSLKQTFGQFYRGNIEAGAGPQGPGVNVYKGGQETGSFSYYGAARILNERLVRPEDGTRPTGEVRHPTRESVEARPDAGQSFTRGSGRSLELDELKTRFMTQHGQEFRVARPHGHSISYDTYQGDPSHSLLLSLFTIYYLSINNTIQGKKI